MLSSKKLEPVGKLDLKPVHRRRLDALAEQVASILETDAMMLDLVCGDGAIAKQIAHRISGLSISCADCFQRADCAISCEHSVRVRFQFEDQSFDRFLLTDVFLYLTNSQSILRDAVCVGIKSLRIKDPFGENVFDRRTLRIMKRAWNFSHGVLPLFV